MHAFDVPCQIRARPCYVTVTLKPGACADSTLAIGMRACSFELRPPLPLRPISRLSFTNESNNNNNNNRRVPCFSSWNNKVTVLYIYNTHESSPTRVYSIPSGCRQQPAAHRQQPAVHAKPGACSSSRSSAI